MSIVYNKDKKIFGTERSKTYFIKPFLNKENTCALQFRQKSLPLKTKSQRSTSPADISLIENVNIGDYVLVHAGFAIQKYNEEEAKITLDLLKELAEVMDK